MYSYNCLLCHSNLQATTLLTEAAITKRRTTCAT